jgi:hypothetical protein
MEINIIIEIFIVEIIAGRSYKLNEYESYRRLKYLINYRIKIAYLILLFIRNNYFYLKKYFFF